jgi:hypothetical protein
MQVIAKAAGVNTIPGFAGVVKDAEAALEVARAIGNLPAQSISCILHAVHSCWLWQQEGRR